MSQTSILIVSDEPEYAPSIMARWQAERRVPAFLLTTTPMCSQSLVTTSDLALIAGVKDLTPRLLHFLQESAKPAILLVPDCLDLQALRGEYPRLILVREHQGWVEVLVALGSEVLRRLEATTRARRAEQALAQAETHAMMGRYMLDMRHSLSNALTSVLGNSELLLLEPGAFSAQVRDQLATIHTMALRIHEILQRLRAMELEVQITANSHSEMLNPPSALAAAR